MCFLAGPPNFGAGLLPEAVLEHRPPSTPFYREMGLKLAKAGVRTDLVVLCKDRVGLAQLRPLAQLTGEDISSCPLPS